MKKIKCHRFRLQYRRCGVWINSTTFPDKKSAEQHGERAYQRHECDGYQVVPLR